VKLPGKRPSRPSALGAAGVFEVRFADLVATQARRLAQAVLNTLTSVRISTIRHDGSNASQVTRGGGEQASAVSPDGKWLLYAAFSMTGPSSIWKMPLPAGTPVRLGDLKDASFPSISPDGRWFSLVYTDERFHPPSAVGIMHLDGSGFQPLVSQASAPAQGCVNGHKPRLRFARS
jgi:hypothetical protein